MQKLLAINTSVARVLVWIGGALLIASAFMVTLDVLLRDFVGVTLGGADEMSGYVFAISTAWALPYALICRTNVRIDALYLLVGERFRSVLDIFGLILLGAFIFPLTWRVWWMLEDSYKFWTKSITPLQTPVAIPQTLWFAGLLLLCLTLLLIVIMSLTRLVRGDDVGVRELAGARTIDEETQESLSSSGSSSPISADR
jgi:TRAP-type C4-dicarboxylate transport system permease small subunit